MRRSNKILSDKEIFGIKHCTLDTDGNCDSDADNCELCHDRAVTKVQEQATAKEIMDFLQNHLWARPDKKIATMKFTDWMKLRKMLLKMNPNADGVS